MTDKDILISDLNDISEILNNNGYGGWCSTILKAITLLEEQETEIENLKQTCQSMMEGVCLLKEQEAAEPKWFIDAHHPAGAFRCSSCGERIVEKDFDFYCSKCGKAVKWE